MNYCSITQLKCKEVISAKTGERLGNVCDVELDICSGRLVALIIWGKSRCGGLLGREDDYRICWEDIEVIGEETILICKPPERREPRPPRHGLIEGLFR